MCLDNRQAEQVSRDLRFFLPKESRDQVLVLPGSESDPYRGLSPHPGISQERVLGIWKLTQGFQGFVVTTLASIASRLPSPADFLSRCIQLEVGDFIPLGHLLRRLLDSGYVAEDSVGGVGEYARRGGIVDIYSPSSRNPVRVEYDGDQIESIRQFDPVTQRSITLVPHCNIIPMREMVITEREIAQWNEEAPRFWSEAHFSLALQEKLQFTQNRELFNGFEYLLPLIIDNGYSLWEFLNSGISASPVRVILAQNFWNAFEGLQSQLTHSFQEQQAAGELALPPQNLFFELSWLKGRICSEKVFYLEALAQGSECSAHFDFHRERQYQGRLKELLADIEKANGKTERVILVMASRGMAERMMDILRDYEVEAYLAEEGFDQTFSHLLSVTYGKLSQGFYSPSLKLRVLTQENIFGETGVKPAARKVAQRDLAGTFLSDFRDLRKKDYVVHIDHGIGIFQGLKRLNVGRVGQEFFLISYRDEAKLYVPVDRLDEVQKYTSLNRSKPQLDRLGGVSWEKTKRRIKKSMQDLAEDLLRLYAQREITTGNAFSCDDALSQEFDEAFQFEETPDQLVAIQDVKRDMESERPMDRLVCGDVGYGKTEVAVRAAFKAAKDSKQVAMLAPTTVLTFQHYRTFRERFQSFPVTIEMISRFQDRREQRDILQRTSLGLVDILIGTHRLLSRDVKFPDLGLIIVDEEQRFGVAQKEKLKKLKTRVDVLTLSATPIPRTLNMSLIGLRDLSIIETPPKDRLAIQTVVLPFNRAIIASAVDLELKRRGQVFFLHNSIETIDSAVHMIQKLVPEVRVALAHGRMSEDRLETVMMDFLDYQYDLLVSTTIIENGLDIPRANTLIVNRADRFGLSQLYQLRGRVGRSSRRAYAYLLTPSEDSITPDARKRLATIKEFSELGAGFRVAALDLEIRGAGNLLGGEQHGQIRAVGFELYTRLMERTIRKLKGEDVPPEVQSNIDLRVDIQIPEHYIDDSNLRLWLYKRIYSATASTLINLEGEIGDRFGKYPRAVSNLFEYARLRLRAKQLKIISLDRRGSKAYLKFREDTPISVEHLVCLVGRNGQFSLSLDGVVSVSLSSTGPGGMFQELNSALDELSCLS